MTDARIRNILSVVILTVICIVVAAVLAAVNMLAEPKIEAAEAEKRAESLKIAMPDGEFNPDPDELKDGAPVTVRDWRIPTKEKATPVKSTVGNITRVSSTAREAVAWS